VAKRDDADDNVGDVNAPTDTQYERTVSVALAATLPFAIHFSL